MELRTGNNEFYIYSSDFEGEKQGEIKKIGTLLELRNTVLTMVNTTDLPVLPVEVVEVAMNPKPTDTVLLIEIETSKAYKIKPCFGIIVRTTAKTWSGGLGRIIEKLQTLINT